MILIHATNQKFPTFPVQKVPEVPYEDVSFKEKDLALLLGTAGLLGRYTRVLQSLLEFSQLVKSENDRFSGLHREDELTLGRYIRDSTEFEMSRIKVLQGIVREYHETASSLIPGVRNILSIGTWRQTPMLRSSS
jgi:hypothetical protein